MQETSEIVNVGVYDRKIDLFESMYPVPDGMAYNSYVILDEKAAVMDTVDAAFTDEWLKNVRKALGKRLPSYLIVQHMEPDHSASILAFLRAYPNVEMIATKKAFVMMKNFFGRAFSARERVVQDGETLSLGKHTLTFIEAPMVHWPEVMMTYEHTTKTLFSADAFGAFGKADGEEWACEARRYYFGIVGKYGVQVQNVLKKLAAFPISLIRPLHGVVLEKEVKNALRLYDLWSRYEAEEKGVVICYTSVYGNTKKAVELLSQALKKRGCTVRTFDLARDDVFEAVEDAFRLDTLVLATTTYNGDMFPCMRTFLQALMERNFCKKTVAFIENGSWSPMATRAMQEKLSACKNLRYAQTLVRIVSALTPENERQISALAEELSNKKE